MTLNDYFDNIFCINLKRRPDRKKEALAEFEKHDIEVEFVEAVDGNDLHFNGIISEDGSFVSPGDYGCVKSHLNIVKTAYQRGYKNYFVFEDDCDIHLDFNKLFSDYIKRLPSDFGLFYLGGNNMEVPLMVTDNIAKISKTFTTHAFGASEKVYKDMISGWESKIEKIDITLSKLHKKYPCYITQPNLVMQKGSYSDILNRYNDDWTLDKRP